MPASRAVFPQSRWLVGSRGAMPHHERHVMSEPITEPVVTEPVATEPVTPEPTQELGEGGIKALQAEREARAAAEKRLKEFEDRDKTEAEKAAERLAAAEKRAAELETKATRAEVAATKAVPSDLLAGPKSTSSEDLAAFADALIAFRGDKGSNGLHVRTEGKSPVTQDSEESEFARSLFAAGD